jgi:hypothetical protein
MFQEDHWFNKRLSAFTTSIMDFDKQYRISTQVTEFFENSYSDVVDFFDSYNAGPNKRRRGGIFTSRRLRRKGGGLINPWKPFWLYLGE